MFVISEFRISIYGNNYKFINALVTQHWFNNIGNA